MSFRAILDANVLVPITLTDLLLRCAEQGFFEPLWSDRILEETVETLLVLDPPIERERAEHRRDLMNVAFPNAQVVDWKRYLDRVPELPDADDSHVCAAALAGRADVIVTLNLKDFPAGQLGAVDLFAQSPDEFLLDLWDLKEWHPGRLVSIVDEMSADGPFTWRDIARKLTQVGVPRFANLVAQWRYDNGVS